MPLLARSALVGAALLACASPRGDRLPPPPAEAPSAAPAEGDDASTPAPRDDEDTAGYIRAHYDKREARIPMRDGVELHTAIYTPKDRGRRYPILMLRTPYGAAPYGPEAMPEGLGPSPLFVRDGYIFVVQDVRGRFLSGGAFVDMRPQLRPEHGPKDIDESTDAYDTISWLIDHVEGHNGRVGMWGISYPGFYAAAGMIRHHPALVAVSPQAPIADWYFDDFHHHGAFFLPHAFNFFARFGVKREGPTTEWPPRFDHGTPDGYQFFLDLGPLANADARHFHGAIAPWTDFVEHP
ncbi:MAG: CocE/NonD family hydrolase, partial [Myxococcales bacterium]|nr:CocE/NonD family hydrolase [Myxococcales bacterium]